MSNGRALRRSIEAADAAAEPAADQVVLPEPVSESVRLNKVGEWLRLELYGPTGCDVHFFDREGARRLAHALLNAASGLVIPDGRQG